MFPDLADYVQVPIQASELQIGDLVLRHEGPPKTWWIDRLSAAAWGYTPAVTSPAVEAHYTGPYLAVDRLHDHVTLLVLAEDIPTPRPHGARITATVRRGCYSDPGGYDVACGCGWQAEHPASDDRDAARGVWLRHKAAALTAMLAVSAEGGRPAAVLVRLPRIADRYICRPYRLMRLSRAGGDWR